MSKLAHSGSRGAACLCCTLSVEVTPEKAGGVKTGGEAYSCDRLLRKPPFPSASDFCPPTCSWQWTSKHAEVQAGRASLRG